MRIPIIDITFLLLTLVSENTALTLTGVHVSIDPGIAVEWVGEDIADEVHVPSTQQGQSLCCSLFLLQEGELAQGYGRPSQPVCLAGLQECPKAPADSLGPLAVRQGLWTPEPSGQLAPLP